MPSSWLSVDTNFPTFTGRESTKEQIDTILNYLNMLSEHMRYTLNNLGTENWNDAELETFTQTMSTLLRTQLDRTAGGLNERIAEAERRVGDLARTVQALSDKLATLGAGTTLGYFGAEPVERQTVTGATDGEKLANLIAALARYGLIKTEEGMP